MIVTVLDGVPSRVQIGHVDQGQIPEQKNDEKQYQGNYGRIHDQAAPSKGAFPPSEAKQNVAWIPDKQIDDSEEEQRQKSIHQDSPPQYPFCFSRPR